MESASTGAVVKTPLLIRFRSRPLVFQFVLAGGAVMLAAMLVIGTWITNRIEQSVVDNTANAAALYLGSFISPLSQELAASDQLSDPAKRALQESFTSTGLDERLVSYKIWKPGGLVVYASDPAIIGQRFPPTPELKAAWSGYVTGSFSDLEHPESATEAALDLPLLEVYAPLREVWSGKIIAVAEFYEIATELERDLTDARMMSWLLVAGVFLLSGLLLIGIVRSGGRTIARQEAMLRKQVAESHRIAAQNSDLRRRVIGASARATAQAERSLRRVSADLHDGPAQYVALAAMRLDSMVPATEAGRGEAETIRGALQTALAEIRTISRGLSLPDIDRLPLEELVDRAVDGHRKHAHARVELGYHGPADPPLDPSRRICLYRFVQEALSNAARHAPGAAVDVQVEVTPSSVVATVRDDGPGFDPASAASMRPDGGEGLSGLRDRAESLGGDLDIITAAGAGTRLVLTLPVGKGEMA
jgi:signal transduction histidine kinase